MKSSWRQVLRLLDDVATIPRRDSVVWLGQISLLACVTFFGMFVARLLSPLQWFKWIARRKQRLSDKGAQQVRPDFHALWTETYFLLVLALLLSIRHAFGEAVGPPSVLDRAVGALFLFEIVVWVIYYGTLRGFIERSYSIYHRTEYLLMVPVAFLVCAAAYALMTGGYLTDAALMFLGAGAPTIIGQSVNVLLFVVVVSYLIAQFPAASVKSDAVEAAKQRVTILGAGDVIEKRALPALLALGLKAQDIRLLAKSERPTGLNAADFTAAKFERIDDDADRTARLATATRNPILIATPTLSHVPLIKALTRVEDESLAPGQRLPLILEKPLCGPGQLQDLRAALQDYGTNHLFALSYYQLEKALPLVFVLTANSGYLPYLHFTPADSKARPKSWMEFSQKRLKLGRLKNVTGRLLEGVERSQVTDDRLWLLDPAHGGVAHELMIHLLVLTQVALTSTGYSSRGLLSSGKPTITWMRETVDVAPTVVAKSWPTGLRIEATVDDCYVDLKAGKYVPASETKRALTLSYERGHVECDFDARTATVFDRSSNKRFTIGIHDAFKANYAVQMDLVRRFIDRGFWSWNRIDGLEAQLASLEWLDKHVAARVS